MRAHCLIAAAVVALSACGQTSEHTAEEASEVHMLEAPPADAAASAGEPGGSGAAETVPATAARIAYAYQYTLSLPTERALSLMARHEQACIEAGPTVCQVLGATSSRYGQDSQSARLELRLLFGALTQRWTDLRVVTPPDIEPNIFAGAVRRFDLAFTAR